MKQLRRRSGVLAALAIGGMVAFAGGSQAGVVQFNFTGHVTDVTDIPGFFAGSVVAGTTIQASFTFDTDGASDGTPGANAANYPQVVTASLIDFGPGFLFNVPLPALTTTPDGLETNDIQLIDNFLSGMTLDGFFMYGALQAPPGYSFAELGISLTDSSTTALASDAIPTAAPDLSAYDGAGFEFHIYRSDSRVIDIYGVIDSINQVPGPSSMALLAATGVLLLRRPSRAAAR